MTADPHHAEHPVYRIEVTGQLDTSWSDWFAGLTVSPPGEAGPYTTITGHVDQATLRGILNRLWDLNLILISVRRVPNTSQPGDTRSTRGA
jgi:hypothetical protein